MLLTAFTNTKKIIIDERAIPEDFVEFKEFTELIHIIRNKNKILEVIKRSNCSSKCDSPYMIQIKGGFSFWTDQDKKRLHIQSRFCSQCGNYIVYKNEATYRIKCNCFTKKP